MLSIMEGERQLAGEELGSHQTCREGVVVMNTNSAPTPFSGPMLGCLLGESQTEAEAQRAMGSPYR